MLAGTGNNLYDFTSSRMGRLRPFPPFLLASSEPLTGFMPENNCGTSEVLEVQRGEVSETQGRGTELSALT